MLNVTAAEIAAFAPHFAVEECYGAAQELLTEGNHTLTEDQWTTVYGLTHASLERLEEDEIEDVDGAYAVLSAFAAKVDAHSDEMYRTWDAAR